MVNKSLQKNFLKALFLPVKEDTIQLDTHRRELLSTEQYKAFTELMLKTHLGHLVIKTNDQGQITFASVDFVFNRIRIKILNFLDEHEIVSTFVETDSGRLSFLLEHRSQILEKMEKSYSEKGVMLKLSERNETKGFVVKGNKAASKDFIFR